MIGGPRSRPSSCPTLLRYSVVGVGRARKTYPLAANGNAYLTGKRAHWARESSVIGPACNLARTYRVYRRNTKPTDGIRWHSMGFLIGLSAWTLSVLRKQLTEERALGEVASDSRGAPRRVDHQHARGGNVQLTLERADELAEPPELGRRGDGLVKVADQADRDAGPVDLVGAGGREGDLLLVPALPDLDLPVHQAVAVADDEVIAQPVAWLPERQRVAGGGLSVVDVNV